MSFLKFVTQKPRDRTGWIAVVLAVVSLVPNTAAGQTRVVLEGLVIEENGPGIEGAIVQLEGHGSVITAAGGRFRFEAVELGPHRVDVRALGYVALSDTIVVTRERVLTISLEIAPFVLDSLVVDAHQIGLRGVVRDGESGLSLPGVEVQTSQNHKIQTDNRGRFEFHVWAGGSIQILIQA